MQQSQGTKPKIKPKLDNNWGIEQSSKLKADLAPRQSQDASQELALKSLNLALDPRDAGNSLELLLSTLSNRFHLAPLQVSLLSISAIGARPAVPKQEVPRAGHHQGSKGRLHANA